MTAVGFPAMALLRKPCWKDGQALAFVGLRAGVPGLSHATMLRQIGLPRDWRALKAMARESIHLFITALPESRP